MIIDCHAHLGSKEILPPSWSAGWIDCVVQALPENTGDMEKSMIAQLFTKLNADETGTELVRQMDQAGIDKTVLLIIDFGLAYPSCKIDIMQVYQKHYKVLQSHPDRYIVFAGIDPRRGKEGLNIFETGIKEFGFKGLKLYPPCGYSPSDELLWPYYDICAKFGLPVLVHIGPSSPSLRTKFALPFELDDAAWKYPEVNFIMGHGAFTMEDQCALLASHRPNVYLDMSGFQTLTDKELAQKMAFLISKKLENKLLFGTDYPIHFFNGNQSNAVEKIRKLIGQGIISQITYDRIMYKNFHTLLNKHEPEYCK